MHRLRSWVSRLLASIRKQKLARDIDEELDFHIERETSENIAKGMSPELARRQALIAFGSPDSSGEACAEERGFRFVEATMQDLRYAIRGISRNPIFTFTVMVTLAFGIGANTAVFSVVNALLLRNLPYHDANRLIYVGEFWPHEPGVQGAPSPDFLAWRNRARTVESLEAYGSSTSLNLTGVGDPGRVDTTQVSHGFLSMLGIKLVLGRNFIPEEGLPGGPPAAILGDQLWRRRFGASLSVIGRQIELDGNPRTVVGVLPPSFLFPDNNFGADLLLPMQLDPATGWNERTFRLLRTLARPKRGVGVETMRKEFADIVRSTAAQEPPQFVTMRKDMQVTAVPSRDWLSGDVRPLLLVLQGAVTMILLIACLNVTNLQIGRAIARQKEIAVRTSLGATRARIAQQLLSEGLLLGLLGGIVGIGAGAWALEYLRSFFPANLHLIEFAHIDLTVMLFTLVVTVLTGFVTGLASTVTAYRSNLSDTLKEGNSRSSGLSGHHRLRQALVVAEVAIAVVLLVASGLLVRSFLRLKMVDLGFDPANLLTLRIQLSGRKYPTPEKQLAFFSQLLGNAQRQPGVQNAAIGSGLPLIGSERGVGAVVEGKPAPPPGGAPVVPLTATSPAYFRTMGMPVLRGRSFADQDREGATLVVIVNQAFANQFFSEQEAIGKHVKFGSVSAGPWYEIVGIVGNVRQEHLRLANSPSIYVPYRQFPEGSMFLIMKGARVGSTATLDASKLVHALDPDQPVDDIATMEMRMANSISADRANMTLMAIFAAVALTLAAIGIFGVITYFVSHRSHEIGVRIALGAQRRDVLWLVLKPGATMTIAGIGIGLAGAFASARVLRKLLYGISTSDIPTFAGVSGLFLLIAVVACYIPASRAARAEPNEVLRCE